MGRPPERKDRGCQHCPAALQCPFPTCPEEYSEQEKINNLLMKQPANKQSFSFKQQ